MPTSSAPAKQADERQKLKLRPQPRWLTVLVVLGINWALMRALTPEPTYVDSDPPNRRTLVSR